MPGNAWGLVVGLMLPEKPLCHSKICLSLRTGCDNEGVLKPNVPSQVCSLAWRLGQFCTFCAFGVRAFLHFVCVPLCFVYRTPPFEGVSEAEKFQCVDFVLSM